MKLFFGFVFISKTMPDLFGGIIMDALRGDTADHINERDDGYSQPSSGLQYTLPYDKWRTSEKQAMKFVKGPMLDIGCGGGRVGAYLNKLGQEYMGIDISSGALNACKEQGIETVILMSLSHLGFQPGYFSTVLMLGNNFGLPGSYDGIVVLLQDLHGLTSKDAIILAQSRDPEATDEPAHHQYHEMNRERGQPTGFVRFHIKYKGEISDWIDLLLCSPEEMRSLAKQAGWSLKRMFGEPNLYIGLLEKM
jgi:SAM-dependent methyltransferase